MRGRLFPVESDWFEWRQEPPLAEAVLVRIAARPDGRLELAGLRIDGPPNAELMRAIPVGRIEAAANAQLTATDLTAAGPSPTGAPAHDPPTELMVLNAAEMTTRQRGRPDIFYRQVADDYMDRSQESHRPASDLAEDHGVPVTTAHRWVREARRRGFLPPGRPGRTG